MESNLTSEVMALGVEFEVLFWTDIGQSHYLRHPSTETKILRNLMFKKMIVQQALEKSGIPSYVVNPLTPNHTLTLPRQTHWQIEEDASVEPMDDDSRHESEDLFWIGVEVSSPPLPLNCGETPPSTGLHVHISMTGGYTFEHLKGIFALSSVAHKQFRQFHSKERVMSTYCVCPSAQFEDKAPSAIGRAVQSCQDISALINMVHVPLKARLQPRVYDLLQSRSRYTALNYMNIATGRQETIEFRTHCGTLDASEITRWIITCGTIVEVGFRYSSLVVPLIEKIEQDHAADGHNYTAAHLFADLGKHQLSKLWTDSLQLHTWSPMDSYRHLDDVLIRLDGLFNVTHLLEEDSEDEDEDEAELN